MEYHNNKTYNDKISPPNSPSMRYSTNNTSSSSPISLPSSSPRRKLNKTVYGDRYIPNRSGVDIAAAFSLSNHEFLQDDSNDEARYDPERDINVKKKQEANNTFSTILRAELFGDHIPSATPPPTISSVKNKSNQSLENNTFLSINTSNNNNNNNNSILENNNDPQPLPQNQSLYHSHSSPHSQNNLASTNNSNNNSEISLTSRRRNSIVRESPEKVVITSPKSSSNLFTFRSPRKIKSTSTFSADVTNEIYSLSPVRSDSQRLLLSPQKKTRQISKVPYRVLDAPELADDFYLNLVDWSSQNVLAVGLGSCVYIWDGVSGVVDRLCDLGPSNCITSLSWIGAGTHLAIGTNLGSVEVWDAAHGVCVRTMGGHAARVGSLAWNNHILSSGSRDRSILNRDVRASEHYINRLDTFHKQEICGLKWNIEENKLASGGNDNCLFVWDNYNCEKPLFKFDEHIAAVKAISWNPHQRGVLASGGGTADRRIKIWNTLTGAKLNDIDTGSQVCNLVWSKNSHELVSTHGYSKNQIIIWKCHQNNESLPSSSRSYDNSFQMSQIASLTGHTYRVLYLAMSPDGESIVTGAGDETLRFWKVFEKNKNNNDNGILLKSFMQLR